MNKIIHLYPFFTILARSHPFNNNEGILQQQQKSIQFSDQRNVGIPQNLAYNRDYPSEVSNKRQNPMAQQPVNVINEHYLVHRGGSGLKVQENSSPPIKKELSGSKNEEPKRENNILVTQNVPYEYLHNPSLTKIDKLPHQPQGDIKEPLRFYKPPRTPINTKDSPSFKSEEGLRLELQNVSPEYIKSLTGQQPLEQKHQDPRIPYSNPNFGLKYSPQPDYKNYALATFQNPSAESLYKFKQALPYKINTQQFLNKPQGNMTILVMSKIIT